MKRESFNAGWEVVTVQKDFPFGTARTRVTLPYDDLLNAGRTPDAPGGAATGYYPDRTATYEKKFFVPEEWAEQKVVLEFEGVYSHSMVTINREYAGGCSHGYTNFLVPADGFLKYGEENEIKVISRTAADSRWYNGAGIYRSVNLLRGNGSYLTPYGLRITTAEADGEGALLAVRAEHGLRINGKTVKLRGTCVHHDNGVLGAADIARAEERRVQLLKEAGFNAVRSAHNPISRYFLEACDREGMLVMDELTDMWTQPKTDCDYAAHFPYHWEEMAEAMVNKDYNHPSVILYSIGNEIPEVGNVHGTRLGRRIAEKLHGLDPTRYTLNSLNLLMAAMGRYTAEELIAEASRDINEVMNSLGDRLNALANSDKITATVRESLAATDIIGYNYATARYRDDRTRLPGRVICGSETYPPQIAENWDVIRDCPHVIGDFTWTGWDYLGEAGIGQIRYTEDGANASYGTFPCFIAYCGDFDITGHRRPVSYFREMVFGLRREPYIAVQYPWQHGKTPIPNQWAFFDGIASWTWTGCEGQETTVRVCAPADSVKLFLNGAEIGEAPVSDFIAEFPVTYQPGVLTAVAVKDGQEIGTASLETAGDGLTLRVQPDRTELTGGDRDLSYLDISLTDERGIVRNRDDRLVRVTVSGAGKLAGLGSANPEGTDSFRADTAMTFDGCAQAVIRPEGIGQITVTVEAEGTEPQTVALQVKQATEAIH